MNEEEKEAIENLKGTYWYVGEEGLEENIKIILNLIEKQSKEIEEYKKQLDLDYVDKHFVPIERYNQLEKEIEELKEKDDANLAYYDQIYQNGIYTGQKAVEYKIKAKIEECEKEKNIPYEMDFKAFYRIKDLKNIEIKVLQSLLDKE